MTNKNPVRAKKQVASKSEAKTSMPKRKNHKKTSTKKPAHLQKKKSVSKKIKSSLKNAKENDTLKVVKSKIKKYQVELGKLKQTKVVSMVNNIQIVKDFEKILKSIESALMKSKMIGKKKRKSKKSK